MAPDPCVAALKPSRPESTSHELRRGRLAMVAAALAWSSAGVMQRALDVDMPTQIVGRAAFASVALLAFVAVSERGRVVESFRATGWPGLGFALSLAISSCAFIVALNHTTVANVLFMQAVSPLIAALLARVALGESVASSTWVAMLVALAGVGVMAGGPGGGGFGLIVTVVMTFGFAAGIVFARQRPHVSMVPASCLAQVLLLVAVAPFASPGQAGPQDLALFAALGIGQIGLGLVFLALGAQLLPAAEVALISLLEVVLGPIWVWLARGEQPSGTTLVGGAIVLGAVVVQSVRVAPGGRARRARRRAEARAAEQSSSA